jgi:hypothetical protein
MAAKCLPRLRVHLTVGDPDCDRDPARSAPAETNLSRSRRSAAVRPATVINVLRRATAATVTSYAEACALDEIELKALLYPESAAGRSRTTGA